MSQECVDVGEENEPDMDTLEDTLANIQKQVQELNLTAVRPSQLPSRLQEEQLLMDCATVRGKIDFFKNRTQELKRQASILKVDLDSVNKKIHDNDAIRETYKKVEKDLHDCEMERILLQKKLSDAEIKNKRLVGIRDKLKEDRDMANSRAKDDRTLLQALLNQQEHFEELISRQQEVRDKESRRFRAHLRECLVKHTTRVEEVAELSEACRESEDILQQWQEPTPLTEYLKNADSDHKILEEHLKKLEAEQKLEEDSKPSKKTEEPEGQTPEQSQPKPGDDIRAMKEELIIARQLFESKQDEVERLAEIANDNNRKISEWQNSLVQSRVTYVRKCIEHKEVLETLKQLKKKKPDASEKKSLSYKEELLVKKEMIDEEHRSLKQLWQLAVNHSDNIYWMYATSVDKVKKAFADSFVYPEKKDEQVNNEQLNDQGMIQK